MKQSELPCLTTGYFSFTAPKFDTFFSEKLSKKGEKIHEIQVKPLNTMNKYEYTVRKGLKLEHVNQEIIGKIISIDINNDEQLYEFIKSYGYLFNLDPSEYTDININSFRIGINFYQNFVKFTDAMYSTKKNYTAIVDLICKLIFIDSSIDKDDFYVHPLTYLFNESYNSLFPTHYPDINKSADLQTNNNDYLLAFNSRENYECIYDSFTNKYDSIDLFDLDILSSDVASDQEYNRDTLPASILKFILFDLYTKQIEDTSICDTSKKITDMLYNLNKTNEGSFKYDETTHSISLISKISTTSSEKEKILDIAKLLLKDVYDKIIINVHPEYNVETGLQDWYIPNLYTAIYFANFVRDPREYVYRICANPDCGESFLVSVLNNRQKYCLTSCRERCAQKRHRYKIKQLEESNNDI